MALPFQIESVTCLPTYILGYRAANRFNILNEGKCSAIMQMQNAIPIEDIGKEREIICGQTTLSKGIVLNHVISLVFVQPSILKFNSLIWLSIFNSF